MRLALQIHTQRARYTWVYGPWIEKIEAATNGRVKITTYPSQSLCKVVDSYDAITTGIADIAEAVHGYTPGRFFLTEVVNLPGLNLSSQAATYTMRDIYEKFPEVRAEYKDMHLIFNFRLPPFGMQTVDTPIRTPEDMKGMKIRTAGGVSADAVKALGGSPVLMGMADVYIALQKGVLDGVCAPKDPLLTKHFYDLEKHWTNVDMGSVGMWFGMSNHKWNSLPPDIQKVFNDLVPWMMDTMPDAWESEQQKAYEARPADFDWYTLSPEEAAAFNELTGSVRQSWVEKNADKGPAQEILDEVIRLSKKYAD